MYPLANGSLALDRPQLSAGTFGIIRKKREQPVSTAIWAEMVFKAVKGSCVIDYRPAGSWEEREWVLCPNSNTEVHLW